MKKLHDMYEEIWKSAEGEDRLYITVCTPEEAENVAYSAKGGIFLKDEQNKLFICLKQYDAAAAAEIRAQADEWVIKKLTTETYDPSFYPGTDPTHEAEYYPLSESRYLVEDGKFAGLVDTCSYSGINRSFDFISCMRIKDYTGKPVYFGGSSRYGSSDMDTTIDESYFFIRRADVKDDE